MKTSYNQSPVSVNKGENKAISCFNTEFDGANIDHNVVKTFGEEWEKFNSFEDSEISKIGDMYFDIVDEKMLNKNSYCIDIGCGTGRWTKYLLDKIGFMEAVDPSAAIYTADKLIGHAENVRFSIASTDNLPFEDETFDFGMSIGVLHHIPDTAKAMANCVKKIKIGGYFYTYLYYNLEDKGVIFKLLFKIMNGVRSIVSSMPSKLKKFTCDVLAVLFYMPIVLLGRFFRAIGLKNLAKKMPLSFYQDMSFFVIRNDSLDRFGTTLEQRFSRAEITEMMTNAGLEQIVISEGAPLYHAVGKRVV